jgi:flagellar assembly factor FliW
MVIATTRFGTMEVRPDDTLDLPGGLLGFEACRRWTLLADAANESLAWMQSLDRPELAVAVVSPRRFAPGYQLRVPARELAGLELARPEDAFVLAIVGRDERGLTLNLKAPLVVNLPRRIGRQVISSDDQPLDYPLQAQTLPLRRSA